MMMTPPPTLRRDRFCLLVALGLVVARPAILPAAEPTTFAVSFTEAVHPGPFTGSVYVMLGPASGLPEPRRGPNWFQPQPFFRVDTRDLAPNVPIRLGANAVGYPGPIDQIPPGRYTAQAVLRLNPDTHRLGDGEGNAFSRPVSVVIGPDGSGEVHLEVTQVVPPRQFPESDRVRLVDLPSPILSAFHKREIRHRAAVVLPEGVSADSAAKRPTLYIIPGFGGDHFAALAMVRGGGPAPFGKDLLRVVLDPDCGTGHHVFADSATNGPRGRAFIEELIPYIEKSFPARPEPAARLLTGHSSGGWSSLWLMVTYPDQFGGVWSTSPDPVDFRDFQRIDLYAPNANMFRDPDGQRRPIARRGTTPILWYDSFSRMEDALGDGGQLHSFEAVFSPLGADGRPRPLWNRDSGAVDPETARAWERYDIRLILDRNWDQLGPKLAGKIHVYMGEIDTFYLEGATRLLEESLRKRGSDAVVEIVPGRDHGNLFDAALVERIDREMHDRLARTREGR